MPTRQHYRGFHAQTLKIFDAVILDRTRCASDPTLPKGPLFGNVLEPPSRKAGAARPSDKACQTPFSGKLVEMVHPRAKIYTAKPEPTGFKNFEGLSVEPLQAARSADLVAVPCRPSIIDLDAIGATLDLCQLAKRPSVVVLNAAPIRSRVVEEAAEAVRKLGVKSPA